MPYHVPALLPQTIQALNITPSGRYVDATFGGGGHSKALLSHLESGKGGMLYAFDQDQDALDRAEPNPCLTLIHANFRYITNFMHYFGEMGRIDGVMADLGVSFHHFDDAQRGFSFREDAPLDMRMNRKAERTAAQLLQEADTETLTSWFKTYGELKEAYRIAQAIIVARGRGEEISTVSGLLKVLEPLLDPRKEKKELACVFQALRIVVNDEMAALKELLQGSLKVLKPGGRLAFITYHSLEDRMVKNFFRTGNVEGKVEHTVYGIAQPDIKPVKGFPIAPDEHEVEENPRSRSAHLRVAEKV